jgi:anti-sigma B factor antagonist
VPVTTSVKTVDGWTVVEVAGELDVVGAPHLRSELVDLVNKGKHLMIVDFAAVEFIDSVGLGALVGALKRIRTEGGEMRIVGVNQHMGRVLRVTGLHRVFDVHDSIDEALQRPRSLTEDDTAP